jgi:hypothetical protein
MNKSYKHVEKIRLYRTLLKGAYRFPLKSRRDIVSSEVKDAFRSPANEFLVEAEIDYKLILGWERAKAIETYATNMYWFHSRDEVTKEMMHYSLERDRSRAAEMERCNNVGPAPIRTDDVTQFRSALFHVHPDYYRKVDAQPLNDPRDVWRARGQHGSDTGGPKQRFYLRRFKALFPQGW